jgi:hypothetical protein
MTVTWLGNEVAQWRTFRGWEDSHISILLVYLASQSSSQLFNAIIICAQYHNILTLGTFSSTESGELRRVYLTDDTNSNQIDSLLYR